MSNNKISDLPDDTAVTLADYVPIVTPGSSQTKKASLARIIALAPSGGSGGTGGGTNVSATFLDNFVVNLPDNQTGIPNGTVVNAGDAIAPFLEAAFRKASPAVYTAPSASLSAVTAPTQVEIGTPISIAFTIAFNQHDAGAETTRVLNKNGSALTPVSGTYSDSVIAALSAINYTATINYAQGGINNNSLGNPDPAGRIVAGSVNSNTLSYQGSYKVFYGATDTAITSANLRALLTGIFLSGATINFNTGNAYKNFYVAVPPGHSLATWVDSSASNANLMGALTTTAITIANGGTGTLTYTLYQLTTGAPYPGSGDLFKFSIA